MQPPEIWTDPYHREPKHLYTQTQGIQSIFLFALVAVLLLFS